MVLSPHMSHIDAATRLRARDFVRGEAACHVSSRVMMPGQTPPLHTHDFPEIFWIEAGRGAHLLPNQTQPLVPGTLALVAANDAHGFQTSHAKGYAIVNVAFTQEYWNAFWQRYRCNEADEDPFTKPPTARAYQLDRGCMAHVKQLFCELRLGQRSARALDRFLLNLLYLLQTEATLTGGAVAPAWLRKSLAALAASPDDLPQGLQFLVQHSGKSPAHLSRECRRWLGATPTDLVNQLRLEEAQQQLTLSPQSIVAVAQALGFLNISHFYRLFRRRFGVTPAECRDAALRVLQP